MGVRGGGEGGVAVTLARVTLDVHVRALTRGMWPACTLEWRSQAAAHWGRLVMQSQRAPLICCHCVLVWCQHRGWPLPHPPPPSPNPSPGLSSLCREMAGVSEGRIHLQCVLYNVSLTMQPQIRDACDESFMPTFSSSSTNADYPPPPLQLPSSSARAHAHALSHGHVHTRMSLR